MWFKLFITDLALSLFSKTTLYLVLIFGVITFMGVYIGQAKYSEVQLLSEGNGDVIQITNTGSFLDRLENILDRSFKFNHKIEDTRWGYIFIFSKLIDFWPLGVALGLLIYGYFFLTRERNVGIMRTLLASTVKLTDYYLGKVFSGVTFWGIFLYFYGFILIVASYLGGGLSRPLFQGIIAGIFLLWMYACLLWGIYLLLSFTLRNYRRAGYVLFLLVVIFTFVVPQGVRLISELSSSEAPEVPYLADYPWTITSIGEEEATSSDEVSQDNSLQELQQYRLAIINYFGHGIQLENRLIYASPVLILEKTLKSYFRPEMLNFQNFLSGHWQQPAFRTVLRVGLNRFFYLLILNCVIFIFAGIYLKRCEIGFE